MDRGYCARCFNERYFPAEQPALYLDFSARFPSAKREAMDTIYCRESPLIRSLACDRFGHQHFDMKTLDRLNDWLQTEYGLHTDIFGLPAIEVVERLGAKLANETLDLALKSEDITIMTALKEASSRTVMQYDLEQSTHLSRRTIGPRLAFLRAHGLVWRPHGERGGETITERGLRFLLKAKTTETAYRTGR